MYAFILFFGEVFLSGVLPADGARYVVAAVSDALYLGYLPEHGAYLCLCVVAQMPVAHAVEVFGYLDLHVVADTLVLLYSCEEFGKGRFVLCSEQFAYKSEHPLYALGERLNLFLRFKYR